MDVKKEREVLLRNCMTPKDDNRVMPWIVARVISEQELSRNASELIDWLVSKCSVYRFGSGVRNNAVLTSNYIYSESGYQGKQNMIRIRKIRSYDSKEKQY